MNPNKIRPLLHYNVTLMFPQDLRLFNKLRKSTARVLRLVDDANNERIRFRRKVSLNSLQKTTAITKLLKPLKFIKSARFKESTCITNDRIKITKLQYIVKKMHKVEAVSIKDQYKGKRPIGLGIWLLYAKRLLSIDMATLGLDESLAHQIEPKIQRLFKLINRLKIKVIKIEEGFLEKSESYFTFQKYPSTLETLCFAFEVSLFCLSRAIPGEIYTNSLSNLTQLKVLHFVIDDVDGIMVHLLNSIPTFSQLETLELKLKDDYQSILTKLKPFINNLRESRKLKKLKVDSSFHEETYTEFFEAIKDCTLSEFSFMSESNIEIEQLISFLFTQTRLEALSLKLKFENSKQGSQQYCYDIMSSLKRFLAKSIKLRSFTLLNYDIRDEAQATSVFEGIIDSLNDVAPFLKKLYINISRCIPSKNQFRKTLDFLNNLNEIEVLDLPIVIPGEDCFSDIVDWCERKKSLRVLQIIEIKDIKSRKILADLIEKVLLKRGLECFSSSMTGHVAMNMYDKSGYRPYVDLQQVKLKNPFLERYPDSYDHEPDSD